MVRDYKKSKKFYQECLKPLGYKMTMDVPQWKAAGYMEGGHTSFWVNQPKKFAPSHVAFLAKNKVAVAAFHRAALRVGGKDNGAPGFRPDYGPTYYAAFVHDLDGNNIEACYFGERAPSAKKSTKKGSKKKVRKAAKKSAPASQKLRRASKKRR